MKYTKDEKMKFVQEFLSSSMTQAEWCRSKGLKAQTFAGWLKNHKENTENRINFIKVIPTGIKPASDAITIQAKGGLILNIPPKFDKLMLKEVLEIMVNI